MDRAFSNLGRVYGERTAQIKSLEDFGRALEHLPPNFSNRQFCSNPSANPSFKRWQTLNTKTFFNLDLYIG